MLHRLFTLDDLYEFYNKQNKTCVFNSQESNSVIIVQIPEVINFSDEYDPTYNLLPVHLMSCHLLENRNRSSISRKSMNEAIPSFKNRPILGYIQRIDDGDGNYHYDFAGHEMELDENGDIEYKETVVGVIPESCNPKIVYNEKYDKDYLEVDGIIFEDYTHAAEILRDKGQCDVSVEIAVDSLSFDAKTKIMNIDSFHFLGVTILGVTTDESHQKIETRMEVANKKIADIRIENNSFVLNQEDFKEEIIAEILSRLNDKDNSKEGGNQEMDKFNELLAKYNKTAEDVTFDYADMTDEELESAFASAFEAAEDSGDSSSKEAEFGNEDSAEDPNTEMEASKESSDESAGDPEVVEDFGDDDPEGDPDADPDTDPDDEPETGDDDHQSTSAIEDEDSTGTKVENSLNYSVVVNGVTKEFAVSLADKINAVTTLVNDTYADSDNCWYYCDVYEDDGKYCVMHDFWSDRHFRQEFSVKKDVYSLKGDRVQVFAQYLTADEITKLDKMKSDFTAIESELNEYKSKELHSAREAVLASEEYSVMADFEEFKELNSHMDEYSVEDLTNKADLIYAKFMKSNYSNFSSNDSKKKSKMVFMTSGDNKEEKKLPYGGLFKNFKNNK